ncbi:MAG: BrnT family toxin [Caldilineaceae bacterium]|nr:BrnT family toxin [Caldilineaceae bacterium]
MANFEWDERKNQENQDKHGISFERAQYVFADPERLILRDKRHSTRDEDRYFCVGRISGGIVTVRFVRRSGKIRIFGAGFWHKYRTLYLERNR